MKQPLIKLNTAVVFSIDTKFEQILTVKRDNDNKISNCIYLEEE
jgi:hypothetical protein